MIIHRPPQVSHTCDVKPDTNGVPGGFSKCHRLSVLYPRSLSIGGTHTRTNTWFRALIVVITPCPSSCPRFGQRQVRRYGTGCGLDGRAKLKGPHGLDRHSAPLVAKGGLNCVPLDAARYNFTLFELSLPPQMSLPTPEAKGSQNSPNCPKITQNRPKTPKIAHSGDPSKTPQKGGFPASLLSKTDFTCFLT
jgi:hypothetical protein